MKKNEAPKGFETYARVVRPTSDGQMGWIAEFPDIPGCFATGQSRGEAVDASEGALRRWLEQAELRGIESPKPGSVQCALGQVRLRVPKTVHRTLALLANEKFLSLNETVVQLLYRAVAREFGQNVQGTECIFLGSSRPSPRKSSGTRFDLNRSYTSNWLQRIPGALHRQLIAWANAEQVSLNALLIYALVRELERQATPSAPVAGEIT